MKRNETDHVQHVETEHRTFHRRSAYPAALTHSAHQRKKSDMGLHVTRNTYSVRVGGQSQELNEDAVDRACPRTSMGRG